MVTKLNSNLHFVILFFSFQAQHNQNGWLYMENKRTFIKDNLYTKAMHCTLSVNMTHENKYQHNKARFRVIAFNVTFRNITEEVETKYIFILG